MTHNRTTLPQIPAQAYLDGTRDETTDELLDLRSTSLLSMAFRFDLVAATDTAGMQTIGEIHPQTAAAISNYSTGALKRSMQNVVLPPDEDAHVDHYRDRVRPMLLLENGAELPMGVFMFADWNRVPKSPGLATTQASLVDQGLILAQPITETFGVGIGVSVVDGITSLLDRIPAATLGGGLYLEGSPSVIPDDQPQVWPISQSNTYSKVLEDLCALGGYYSPYYDNSGRLVIRQVPILDEIAPDVVIDEHIIADTLIESDNLLDAPNVYIVINTAAASAAVVGTYVVPARYPHSVDQRGFTVPRIIEIQGLSYYGEADEIARSAAAQDVSGHLAVNFSTLIDPRHDTFTIVSYRGQNYWETSWQATLEVGGTMTHTLQAVLTSE